MSVKIRPFRNGGWEADIRVVLPDRRHWRERRKVTASSRSVALRWAEARERELLLHGPPQPKKEVPTLEQFVGRFLEGYARANRHKPSGIASKDSIIRTHLVPSFGQKPLDTITTEDIQLLKKHLGTKAPKTVNNVLTVLNTMLKTAVSWGVIVRMPATVGLLKTCRPSAQFYDFGEYEALVAAAEKNDHAAYVLTLLGGEAGLRCGEIMALEWGDVDLAKRQLTVRRSDWKGHVTVPKGGRARHIPLTTRLAEALRQHRHLRGARVLCSGAGEPLTQKMVQDHVRRAARRAGLQKAGVHMLRHTFCSHLAMRGAPARAIQELAGHQDLGTTQRYMHLSPAAIDSAIRLLDEPVPRPAFGDMLETGRT